MNRADRAQKKISRLLKGHFPDVRTIGRDEWTIRNQSSVTFIQVAKGLGSDGFVIRVNSPLTYRVPLGSELFRYVATEGQDFQLGRVYLVPSGESNTCELWFGHNFAADGLRKSSILASIYPVIVTSNDLDDHLKDRFGGLLAGERIGS